MQAPDPQRGLQWFCEAHKQPHHVNQRSAKCQFSGGCLRQAVYGPAGDQPGQTDQTGQTAARAKLRCARHALPGDLNLNDPLCREAGCTRRATFGEAGARPQRCGRHARPEQVDLVQKLPPPPPLVLSGHAASLTPY